MDWVGAARRLFCISSIAILVALRGFHLPPAAAHGAEESFPVAVAPGCVYTAVIVVDFGGGRFLDIRNDGGCQANDVLRLKAVEDALALVQRKGRLAGLTGLLVRDEPAVWTERFVDCFIDRYGRDSRRAFSPQQIVTTLNGCDVYRELAAILRPYGLGVRVGSVEKVAAVDFRRLPAGAAGPVFSSTWISAHKGARGRLPSGAGTIGLKLIPLH